MNHCIFTGYLLNDPSISLETDDGCPACCVFKLITYEYVRNKQGEKKRYPTTITFQAWDSGAETIAKLGKKGMKMTIYASARNNLSEGDVIFRVNQFDFGCMDKE